MTFSKEARIGLLVAIAILILITGFYFLRGSNLFSRENTYYCYFANIQGLQASAPVQIKGFGVGRVAAIKLEGNRVKVTISVSKKTQIPEGTVAKLASADLLGSKVIALELGTGVVYVKNEGTLPTTIEGGIIDNLSTEISPLIQDIRVVIARLDTTVISINGILNEETQARLNNSIASLEVTMNNFSQLSQRLNNESAELQSIIRNANSIASNLADNNSRISNILRNAETTTNQLSRAPIEGTVKDLQTAANQLQGVINKINNNQGSLGMLVNDKELYTNLSNSLNTLNKLMADLQAHPSRYINVTIFGKKRKDK
jgi:phospholipid/cholesterol/gamma-HCH transport system substrate-binding protein